MPCARVAKDRPWSGEGKWIRYERAEPFWNGFEISPANRFLPYLVSSSRRPMISEYIRQTPSVKTDTRVQFGKRLRRWKHEQEHLERNARRGDSSKRE